MSIIFQREIDEIKKRILSLCAIVEESVWRAVKSLEERDEKLAQAVIDEDMQIDQMEVLVEEECLKLLALHQPVAVDLRFIVAVLKINNDLERIGDYASNIAERAKYLAVQRYINTGLDFSGMAQKVQSMLRKSLDALVTMEADLAREVLGEDDEVDATNREVYHRIKDQIRNNPDDVDYLINLLSIAKYLERIADLATNICEDVIYLIKGEIVRHQAEDSGADVH